MNTQANPPENTKPDDEIMCDCSGTTRGEIISLFEQGKDMDGISRWTGALSGCGGCEWDIADLLNELAAQKATAAGTANSDNEEPAT